VHPAIEDVTVEGILHALSDPVRVAIYADIVGSVGSLNCSNFLKVSEKTIPKSTLSQHFKALREAGLIRGERRGVEMHNTSRCAEIVKAHNIQLEQNARIATAGRRKAGKVGKRAGK